MLAQKLKYLCLSRRDGRDGGGVLSRRTYLTGIVKSAQLLSWEPFVQVGEREGNLSLPYIAFIIGVYVYVYIYKRKKWEKMREKNAFSRKNKF